MHGWYMHQHHPSSAACVSCLLRHQNNADNRKEPGIICHSPCRDAAIDVMQLVCCNFAQLPDLDQAIIALSSICLLTQPRPASCLWVPQPAELAVAAWTNWPSLILHEHLEA